MPGVAPTSLCIVLLLIFWFIASITIYYFAANTTIALKIDIADRFTFTTVFFTVIFVLSCCTPKYVGFIGLLPYIYV